jgi:hypothetical protein
MYIFTLGGALSSQDIELKKPPVPPVFHEEDLIEVYINPLPELFGRSLKRDGMVSYRMGDFVKTKTLPVNRGYGRMTATVIRRGIIEVLEEVFKETNIVTLEEVWFSLDDEVLTYWNSSLGYLISFSVSEPSDELLRQVDVLYSQNDYWRQYREEVLGFYKENYVLRIHSAEDCSGVNDFFSADVTPGGPRPDGDQQGDDEERKEPFDFTATTETESKLSWEEIMAAATVIGNGEQKLWGIPDGLDVLAWVEDAAVEDFLPRTRLDFNDYRPYTRNTLRMYQLIDEIEAMPGRFAENLYKKGKELIRYERREGPEIFLPEIVIDEGFGDCSEYALFFYDILKRKHYETGLILTRREEDEEGHVLCIFRHSEKEKWNVIDTSPPRFHLSFEARDIPDIINDDEGRLYYFIPKEKEIEMIFEKASHIRIPDSEWSFAY